ncbi:hypothetical protein ACFPK1_03300 [Actinomycetospora rhizophila]|uniref:Uncharacterized protein n=1 Tax=Actinomycetospora rhizophila TaxID=1416876 RepID=A0ABV9Z995_9PSEU
MQPLVDKGYLDAALGVLGERRESPDSCVQAILAQIGVLRATAAAHVGRGEQLRDAGDFSGAATSYRAALTANIDNLEAREGLAKVTATDPPQILSALIPTLTWLVIFFAAGSAASYLVPTDFYIKNTSIAAIRRMRWGGVLLLLAAAILLGHPALAAVGWWRVTAVLPALLGIAAIALYTAWRLSVRVTVTRTDGKSDNAAAGYIIGMMNELGADTPRGVRIPQGTDVAALPDDALIIFPQGKILSALAKLVRTAVPTAAWYVRVELVDSTRCSVQISRNGKAVAVHVVQADELVPAELMSKDRDAEATLWTGVASFALLALSEKHIELTTGLCGANRWDALATYVIGARRLFSGDVTGTQLFAISAARDPSARLAELGNLVASVQARPYLATAVSRELGNLANEISKQGGPAQGWEALELRCLLAEVSIYMNATFEPGADKVSLGLRALRHAILLMDRCDKMDPENPASALAEEMKVAAAYRWLAVRLCLRAVATTSSTKWSRSDVLAKSWLSGRQRSSRDRYDHACYLLMTGLQADRGVALGELRIALLDPTLRSWAVRDPCLRGIRDELDLGQLSSTNRRGGETAPDRGPSKLNPQLAGAPSQSG